MSWIRWVIPAIGLIIGGWTAFDGSRALIKGDYVTPREGAYAGQLGPWAGLVRGVGLEPRSTPVKSAFVILGIAWLVMSAAYLAGARWSWTGLVVLSVLTLWYLPLGTVLAVIELVLLFIVRSRST